MDQRLTFIQACLDRTERIVDICARFGISEKTGHKLLHRFRTDGVAGLAERSHAPQTHPQRMARVVAERILALRRQHPLYGAAKLRDWLLQHEPESRWPAASSIGALLKRAGLIRARRRARGAARPVFAGHTPAHAPNHVWTADFKGQFRLGTGPYCYPLTVLDLHSHFLLTCRGLPSTAVHSTRAIFRRLFQDYGLPEVLRTDNGIPFAQPNALGRLGALAFWWVRLGIRPEHTRPATPAENGAHERFHRTLKAAVARPPAHSVAAQQARFDAFRREYNCERPHASCPAHQPPAQGYTPSPRPYPARLPALCYPATADVRRVSSSGSLKWHSVAYFLSNNLADEYVGLLATDSDRVTVAYGALALGDCDPHTHRFLPSVRWLG